MTRKQILCVMRMPPNAQGHGGSQRAQHLLDALVPHGDVHFVLIYREQDGDCVHADLSHVERMTASVTRICVPGWQTATERKLFVIPPGLWNILKMGSQEAPRLSAVDLDAIARSMPVRDPDVVFACRVCTAHILESVRRKGWFEHSVRVIDFDDIMSKFRLRQLRSGRHTMPLLKRLSARWDAYAISSAETTIVKGWHGASACTAEDVDHLARLSDGAATVRVPNVVERPLLPPRQADGTFRILFTGNLSFTPNVTGLRHFVHDAFPALRRLVPHAWLDVVGMGPTQEVRDLCRGTGINLQENVPRMEPHYLDCDVVIAPILFGSGTRIKILEAMAYGRPVVSTPMGAEGMGLIDGLHLLLVSEIGAFADALHRLSTNPELRMSLVRDARAYQQANYTPPATSIAIHQLLSASETVARRGHLRTQAAHAA